ncbi:MAG: ISNCY family transposase [Verrucomicrobia bacterium]|nr:ISNCY family transposase [Verrucomicrobiota bacterium]
MKEQAEMSIKEAERLSVLRQVDKKILTLKEASEELGICLRQMKRIRKCYLNHGEKGLISAKRGKESNRKISKESRDAIIDLVKQKYIDFGPTLASEKLEELDGIKISSETLRKWFIAEGIWKSKRKKEVKIHQRRARRSQFGELLQGDGSPHDWFEGRSAKCTLLQFVDDATSNTTVARFEPTETTDGYLKLLEEHLKEYGRPLGLYVDKHSTFKVNKEELKKGTGITHFGQVVKDLEIELICANSPQAKGRVERKNGVFQDRLIKEMRLLGINTIEEGNKFLPKFLKKLNKKFGVAPAIAKDAHRPLRLKDDLKKIFARKDTRKLSKDLTFQHNGILYLIETKTPNRMRHATVIISWLEEGVTEVQCNGVKLKYKKWAEKVYEQPKVLDRKEVATGELGYQKKMKPGKHHPWK